MSTITLKTAKRKTAVSRLAVRKAVAATFVAGTFKLKKDADKRVISKASSKATA